MAGRVLSQPSFVLRTQPFLEESLIADIFTPESGRLRILAKNVRRVYSEYYGVVREFQPLLLSWRGGGDLLTMVKAERPAVFPVLFGSRLICAFYLNELILRLLPLQDGSYACLFDVYSQTIRQLAQKVVPKNLILRCFEKRLLCEIGYALSFDRDAVSGEKINAHAWYVFEMYKGFCLTDSTKHGLCLQGKSLLDIHEEQFTGGHAERDMKILMRYVIDLQLHGRVLKTRAVLDQLTGLVK